MFDKGLEKCILNKARAQSDEGSNFENSTFTETEYVLRGSVNILDYDKSTQHLSWQTLIFKWLLDV